MTADAGPPIGAEGPWSKPGDWRNRSKAVRISRLLRTRRPTTFNDKVRYKMLRDRRPLLVTWADKVEMRRYVASEVGEVYLPRLLHLLDSASDLKIIDLPDSFVLKPTHGSGACIVVDESAPVSGALPYPPDSWVYTHVRRDQINREQLKRIADHWLSQRYGRGPNHEWAYGLAARRLLAEELLRGYDAGIPNDYKFFVFHGHCHFVQVDRARFAGANSRLLHA